MSLEGFGSCKGFATYWARVVLDASGLDSDTRGVSDACADRACVRMLIDSWEHYIQKASHLCGRGSAI